MQVIIVPLCNNQNGDISDGGNYKLVSLATTISNLFEHCILTAFDYLLPPLAKFGGRPQHVTEMCVLLLKQIVSS